MWKDILDCQPSHHQLPGKRASGRILVLLVIVMILVLCLPGCGEVYITSPLGPPAVIDKEKFEGLWLLPHDKNDVVATARFDENGQIQVNARWTEGRIRFGESQVIVTEDAKYNYLSIRSKEENGWENKYYFAQYTFCGDHLVVWIPDAGVFKRMIDAYELSGFKKNADVYITSPPETLVQFLNEAPDQLRMIYYLGPFIFRKFRGIGETEVDISMERCAADIQYSIGIAYDKDKDENHVLKDDIEVVKWYREAAEQGYAPAQYELAKAYYQGPGVPQDDAEVVKWLRLALDQGYEDAMGGLAWMRATSPDETVRDGAEALRLAETFLNVRNENAVAGGTLRYQILAAAYAEAGRFEDAVTTQKKVLTMTREDDPDLYIHRLGLWTYLRQEPWRDKERQQN